MRAFGFELAPSPMDPASRWVSRFREEPDPGDMELEQHGLRIFVQDVLVEPLDGRVLDVREAAEGMELVFC